MCAQCDEIFGPSLSRAEKTINLTVATAVVEKLVETVETGATLGLTTVAISEREDGPVETFLALTGPGLELEAIYLAILSTGYPAQLQVI